MTTIDVSDGEILALIREQAQETRNLADRFSSYATKADVKASIDRLQYLVDRLPDDAILAKAT